MASSKNKDFHLKECVCVCVCVCACVCVGWVQKRTWFKMG